MRRIRKHIRTLIIVSIPFFTTLIVKAQQMLPYQNPQLSVEERVNDLLGRMTLEEKIGQITHLHSYKVFDGQELNPNKLEVACLTLPQELPPDTRISDKAHTFRHSRILGCGVSSWSSP